MVREVTEAEASLGVRSLDGAFRAVQTEYLARPYLPAGKCVLLDADGGTGKTSLALAFAASLSRGLHPITLEALDGEPVRTLYLHKGEDSDEELETVYRANGGVPGLVAYAGSRLVFNDAGCKAVAKAVRDGGYRFVVVDALMYFLEGTVKDSNAAMEVNPAIQRLNGIARATGCTFLNIRHTRKGAIGAEASALGMGSVAFRNAHRGQLVARFHPDRQSHGGLVVVTDEKGSLMVQRGEAFMFRREGHEVQYVRGLTDPFALDVRVPKRGKRGECAALLLSHLENGPRLFNDLAAAATEAGHSVETLRRAKEEIGVVTRQRERRHYWMLPRHTAAWDLGEEDGYDAYADR